MRILKKGGQIYGNGFVFGADHRVKLLSVMELTGSLIMNLLLPKNEKHAGNACLLAGKQPVFH